MISLGIICYQGHSSSAALVQDGLTLGAVSEERFTRKKFDDSFPAQSIEYLTRKFNISFDQIDHIAVAWSPKLTFLGQLQNLHKKSWRFIFEKREGTQYRSRLHKFFLILNLKFEIKKRYNFKNKISFIDHHLAHAVSAFIQTEQKDGVTMVADGMGEFASTTIYEFNSKGHKIIYQDKFPHSMGVFYSAGTQFLGFTPDSDEFKVMGLAAYSTSEKYHDRFNKLYKFNQNNLELDLTYFDIHKKGNQFYADKFTKLFPDVISAQDKMDFAYSLQVHLTKIVISILEKNKHLFKAKHFSASGGVFLNCLLNQQIRQSGLFKAYDFFPVADDNGTALGAAQATQMFNSGHKMKKLENLYLGPDIAPIDETLFKKYHFKKIDGINEVAQLLAGGKVVAWVQGRMEFGHRSLGNRSILGDPRQKSMKDMINEKVKFREQYRPFAPGLLVERLEDFYECDTNVKAEYPFMIETLNAKALTKEIAPAIVHEDGTSRVQTVSPRDNPKFYQLIAEFNQLTGCPILLNTSFNINGMPIVLSVEDALDCFSKTKLDYLVIEDYLLWK